MGRVGTKRPLGLMGALMLAGCATVGLSYRVPPLPAGISDRPASFAEGKSPAYSSGSLPQRW